MSSEVGCIFCMIVSGEAPSTKLYEDELVVAIMDINPATDGHLLVISKEHAADIFELSEEALVASMQAAGVLSKAVRQALEPDGVNLLQANGRAAFQTVFHYHLHVIPRWESDDIRPPWIVRPGDPAKIGEVAQKIASALGS